MELKIQDYHKLIDPPLSFRLCLDGLHPEVCFSFSFSDILESVLRDLLRDTFLGQLLLLLLLLHAAVAVIQSSNIFSIHCVKNWMIKVEAESN